MDQKSVKISLKTGGPLGFVKVFEQLKSSLSQKIEGSDGYANKAQAVFNDYNAFINHVETVSKNGSSSKTRNGIKETNIENGTFIITIRYMEDKVNLIGSLPEAFDVLNFTISPNRSIIDSGSLIIDQDVIKHLKRNIGYAENVLNEPYIGLSDKADDNDKWPLFKEAKLFVNRTYQTLNKIDDEFVNSVIAQIYKCCK